MTCTDADWPDFAPGHENVPVDDIARPCGNGAPVTGVGMTVHEHEPEQPVADSVAVDDTALPAGTVITGALGQEPPCTHGRDLSHAIGGVDWHPSCAGPLVVVPPRLTVFEPPPSVPPVFDVHGLGLYMALCTV